MIKDILLAAVFLLNVALMAYISFDVIRRKKDSSAEKAGEAPDVTEETKVGEASTQIRKAGIGKSRYSVDDVKRIVAKATEAAVVELFNEDIEIDDVEFDVPEDSATPPYPQALSHEEINEAFETDKRIAEEIAASDTSVVEPKADGATFDELARAELILGRKSAPTTEEHRYVVRVFADFKNTELMTRLPRYILDKLDECHRKADEIAAERESSRIAAPETVNVKAYGEFELADFLPKYQKTISSQNNETLYHQ